MYIRIACIFEWMRIRPQCVILLKFYEDLSRYIRYKVPIVNNSMPLVINYIYSIKIT